MPVVNSQPAQPLSPAHITTPSTIDRWITTILLVYISTLPLLVFGKEIAVTSPLISTIDVLSSGKMIDFYTYIKLVWTIVVTLTCVGLFFINLLIKKTMIQPSFLNLFIILFIIVIFISTLTSETIHLSLIGTFNRSTGAIAWICYIALFFVAMQLRYPKKYVTFIMYGLMPTVVINFFLLTLHFYHVNILSLPFVTSILTSTLPDSFVLPATFTLFGTMDQLTYLSGFFAMTAVSYLIWALTSSSKTINLAGSLFAALSTLIIFLTTSTSGFFTLLICLPFLLFIGFKLKPLKQGKFVISIFIGLLAPIFILFMFNDARIFHESFGSISTLTAPTETSASLGSPTDEAWNDLPILAPSDIGPASGRKYIWDHTLALMDGHYLFGYGLDTFMYRFPHFNEEARANFNSEQTIVDHTYNIFIEMYYSLGVAGLVLFVLFTIYLINLLLATISQQLWPATILSIFSFAFIVQGFFNGSFIATSALAILFVGISTKLMNDHESRFYTNDY
jgi:O-antigen ligase